MPKECLHDLSDSIRSASEGMCFALNNLDEAVLKRVRELPAAKQIDFYEWASKYLAQHLKDQIKK